MQKKGDTLYLPYDIFAASIIAQQQNTWIDINIPEFKLRIVEWSDTILLKHIYSNKTFKKEPL